MDLLNLNGFELRALSKVNVILGKNGSGKSFLLKQVEPIIRNRPELGKVRYVSPERGGSLQYDPNIENQMVLQPNWIDDRRRQNQSQDFRQQSAALFRRLELKILREIEKEHIKEGYEQRTFDETIQRLNKLLDRIVMERDDDTGYKFKLKNGDQYSNVDQLSSGETEIISLAIEILSFIKECPTDKANFLLIDEPDVHLHPDLQARFADFIISEIERATSKSVDLVLIVATHSTSLLAGLARNASTRVSFMRSGDTILRFKEVTDVDRAILPIFGAHPLSNVFNQNPILLVEGDDDARIWQQAIRSASGRIRLTPCVVDGVGNFADFEREVQRMIEAIYDSAKGYSLRDRDVGPGEIDDLPNVVRMRLNCRAAENLLLSDDTLALAEIDWSGMQRIIQDWLAATNEHRYRDDMAAFVDGGMDRKGYNLKNIRNILVGLVSEKPWEVLVGQAISNLSGGQGLTGNNSLRDYLGEKVGRELLGL